MSLIISSCFLIFFFYYPIDFHVKLSAPRTGQRAEKKENKHFSVFFLVWIDIVEIGLAANDRALTTNEPKLSRAG